MSIIEKVVIKDPYGLHLRAAVGLILAARKYKSRIILKKGLKMANAQSILGLLSLEASRGTELEVVSEGEDVPEALGEIRDFFNSPKSWS
jgi:phosphotransferase system HPr (HPr) family protein